MFTGIIRHLGSVTAVSDEPEARLLTIATPLSAELRPGDSVAVNGVCLTVLRAAKNSWEARLMKETLARTNLGNLAVDSTVNLELPLRASQGIDGHFVMGHVDSTAEIAEITPSGGDQVFRLSPPADLMCYLVPKGSVALDGVSLTVVDVDNSTFTVSIMPYTLEHTTFGTARAGNHVNIEVDMIGKYVVSAVQRQLPQRS